MLKCNPVYITNRIQQLAVKQLRNATKELKGDDKWDKM